MKTSRCAKFPISDNFCCLVEGRLKTLRVPFSGREHRRTNFVGSFRRHTGKKKASLVASARPRKPEQCLDVTLYTLVCHGTALESTLASIMLIDFSFAFSSSRDLFRPNQWFRHSCLLWPCLQVLLQLHAPTTWFATICFTSSWIGVMAAGQPCFRTGRPTEVNGLVTFR